MIRVTEKKSRIVAHCALFWAAAVVIAACGDDSPESNTNVGDAGTNNISQSDAGTDPDAEINQDAGPVECPEDQFPVEGECTRGGMNVIVGGFGPDFQYTSGFVSFYADPGPTLERVEVTDSCSYTKVLGSGPEPTAPDCFDAGTLTIRYDGGEITAEPGESCYSTRFEDVEIVPQTVTFSFAGGADFAAVDIDLDIAAPADLVPETIDGDVRVTRVNADETRSYGYLFTASNGPTIFCEETSAGELLLTAEDITAIHAVDGDHSDAVVFHSANQYAVEGDLFINAVSQSDVLLLNVIPPD